MSLTSPKEVARFPRVSNSAFFVVLFLVCFLGLVLLAFSVLYSLLFCVCSFLVVSLLTYSQSRVA